MPCGDCKWWESNNERDQHGNDARNSSGYCIFPLPVVLLRQINNYNNMTRSADGLDCNTHTPRDSV